jgi:hypothetical protein
MAAFEPEDDTPLIVDSDGVSALASSLQRFQPVARWNAKIMEIRGIVQIQDFASRGPQELRRTRARFLRPPIVEEVFGQAVSEALDHMPMLS